MFLDRSTEVSGSIKMAVHIFDFTCWSSFTSFSERSLFPIAQVKGRLTGIVDTKMNKTNRDGYRATDFSEHMTRPFVLDGSVVSYRQVRATSDILRMIQ